MEICDMTYMKSIGAPSLEAQVLYRRALEMAGQGRHEAALNVLRQVVMIAPRFTKALQEMGNTLDALGRYPEALTVYSRLLEIDPLNEGASIKKEIISKKIENFPTKRQYSVEKTSLLQKRERRVPHHSFMDDLAAVARIPMEETINSHRQTVHPPDSRYLLKVYGGPIC
jgi:tetratricopeptide (TPR) repeat protein